MTLITTMKKTLFLSTLLASVFFSTQALAHSYHYEMQITNALLTNDKRQLEALRLTFLYDGDVSNAMLQDQKDLQKLGGTLVDDLGKLGYFTQIKLNGKVLNASKATDIKLEKVNIKIKDGAYDALQLQFTLPFNKPAKISKNSEIALVHEDPTEAAILYYENAEHIILGDSLKDNCKASVKEKGKFKEGEFPQIIRVNCQS